MLPVVVHDGEYSDRIDLKIDREIWGHTRVRMRC